MIEPLRRDIEQVIRLTAVQLGLPVPLALKQCEVESSFNYLAANPSSGCFGLFQLSKVAEKDLNERILKRYQTRYDFLRGIKVRRDDWRSNIFGGCMYMRYLLDHYGKAVPKSPTDAGKQHDPGRDREVYARALAAYNWGMGHVDGKIEKLGPSWWAQLPRETGEYLQKILGTEAPNYGVSYA